jgi:hypothetical protein
MADIVKPKALSEDDQQVQREGGREEAWEEGERMCHLRLTDHAVACEV